jgi:hypothetical protein
MQRKCQVAATSLLPPALQQSSELIHPFLLLAVPAPRSWALCNGNPTDHRAVIKKCARSREGSFPQGAEQMGEVFQLVVSIQSAWVW